jgi:hypothetical protein
MKRILILILLLFTIQNLLNAQSIISSRIVDFSVANVDYVPDDQGNQVNIVDSNTYLSQVRIGKKAYYIRAGIYFNPSLLISDSSFNFTDTISFPDTARNTKICYDKNRKQMVLG